MKYGCGNCVHKGEKLFKTQDRPCKMCLHDKDGTTKPSMWDPSPSIDECNGMTIAYESNLMGLPKSFIPGVSPEAKCEHIDTPSITTYDKDGHIEKVVCKDCGEVVYGSYTKQDLLNLIDELLPQIRDKFAYKNKAYGRDEDAFHNFRNTAKRVLNDDSFEGMYKTLLVYKDKHDVALANRGMDDPEFEERFIDNIVYSLIAIGMNRARS